MTAYLIFNIAIACVVLGIGVTEFLSFRYSVTWSQKKYLIQATLMVLWGAWGLYLLVDLLVTP